MVSTSTLTVLSRKGAASFQQFRVHQALPAFRVINKGRRSAHVTKASGFNEESEFNYGKSMGFAEFAPETINGRAAQIGFVAGLAAEIATGDSFPTQLYEHPTTFAFVVAFVTAATYFPSAQGASSYTSDPETLGNIGLFTAAAERTNGRAAMLGVAAMLTLETLKGGALFG